MSELPEVGAATGTASLAWLLFALPALGAAVLLLAAIVGAVVLARRTAPEGADEPGADA